MILSKSYKEKAWTNHELESAQERAFKENKEYILPIRLDNTQIPGILVTINYIDYNSTALETIIELIVSKLENN
jgi:hypothetical protein